MRARKKRRDGLGWYEYGDELFAELSLEIHTVFVKAKLMDFDEINGLSAKRVQSRVETIYRKLKKRNEDYWLDLYLFCYEAILREWGDEYRSSVHPPSEAEIQKRIASFLRDCDPVTGYIYDNEVERCKQRLFERLMAEKENKRRRETEEAYNTAERYWMRQTRQMFIDIEDLSRMDAMEALGVDKVMWSAILDTRVCDDCEELDGEIFLRSEVPPKPHINCRCVLIPVRD